MKFTAPIYLLVLIPLWCSNDVSAQTDSVRYDTVMSRIQKAFHAKQPNKIYEMTAQRYQAKMTGEQFAVGMNKFMTKMGEWITYTYQTHTENGRDYLVEFEGAKQLFSLQLDQQGKIERMNFAVVMTGVPPKTYQMASTNPLADSLDLRIEQLVRPYIQKGINAGLVLAIIDHDQIRRYSYGTVAKTSHQLPDPDKTIFEIGSVTKTFTSLLVAQQVLEGRMQLTDPINRYLPDSVPSLGFQGSPIRMIHLTNHTAGFPRLPANIFNGKIDPKNPYCHYVTDSLYRFLVHFQPTRQPGTLFSYSNYGAGLLGRILEEQLQMDFDKLVVEKIAKPLGMVHTFVELPLRFRADFAQGYNENGLVTPPWELASLKGSGAIRSTLNDMIRYTKAQLGGNNPLRKAIALSHHITFNGPGQVMGLAWRITQAGGQTYYHHSGGTGGFRSFVGFDLKGQRGIVILSNTADEVTAIGESLLQTSLGIK